LSARETGRETFEGDTARGLRGRQGERHVREIKREAYDGDVIETETDVYEGDGARDM